MRSLLKEEGGDAIKGHRMRYNIEQHAERTIHEPQFLLSTAQHTIVNPK